MEDVKCPPVSEWGKNKYFKYTLKESILLKPGQCLDFALYIQHQPGNEYSLYESDNCNFFGNDDFKLHDSKLAGKRTRLDEGQLPCIWYAVVWSKQGGV